MILAGIDLAHPYQALTDAEALRASGVIWASHKLTQGLGYSDPSAIAEIGALRAAGISVGGYHYFEAGVDARGQAQHFLDFAEAAGLEPGQLCVDIETVTAPGGVQDWEALARQIDVFVSIVHPGYIYWNKNYRSFLWRHVALWGVQEWVGTAGGDKPAEPLAIWQYGQRSDVPGVSGNCDLDYIYLPDPPPAPSPAPPLAVPAPGTPPTLEFSDMVKIHPIIVGPLDPHGNGYGDSADTITGHLLGHPRYNGTYYDGNPAHAATAYDMPVNLRWESYVADAGHCRIEVSGGVPGGSYLFEAGEAV